MKRLVAVGRKYPEYHTQFVTYATSDENWHPLPDPQGLSLEPDHDHLRKVRLESEEDPL